MIPSTIYWLRNDLRLHDNATLAAAIKTNEPLLMVYCVDPRHFELTALGFRKTGILRFRFLMESLQDLRKACREKGSDLLIKVGKPENVLPELISEHNTTHLFYQKEVTSEETDVEAAVELAAAKLNCNTEAVWGLTLYHVDDSPFPPEETPLTSKTFRLTLTKQADVRPLISTPEQLPDSPKIDDWGELPTPEEIGFLASEINEKDQGMVAGGETAALARLENYTFETELLTGYRWSRNRSLGMDYSSKFSPWMALGCLSPRMIYWKVKEYEEEIKKNASTWWLIFEVVWRDYFKFQSIRFGNKIFAEGGIKNRDVAWEYDYDLFARWQNGTTGIPFIDAHMRELNQTGFMSNRGRVNCASFLTRDYKIDWRWGAAWFETQLLDYDVSSNWLNWNTQATEIWYTNPVHQGWKYDKKGEYVKTWLPELANVPPFIVQAPWLLGEEKLVELSYPQPVEIYKKWQRSINKITKDAEGNKDGQLTLYTDEGTKKKD